MTSQARFVFSFDSAHDATLVARALSPEITHRIPKSNVVITVDKKTLTLVVESDEVHSLRAACNSYLRWVQTALSVSQVV